MKYYATWFVIFGILLAIGLVLAYFGGVVALITGTVYALFAAFLSGVITGVLIREQKLVHARNFDFLGRFVNSVLGFFMVFVFIDTTFEITREEAFLWSILAGLFLFGLNWITVIWARTGYFLEPDMDKFA